MTEDKLQYRVRDGHRHGSHKQYGPGTVLELTEAEAAGFLDKLELVPAAPAQPAVDKAKPPAAEPAPKRRPKNEA